MKSFLYMLPLGFALLSVSCQSNNKTASTNPYQNNPYYGTSSNTTDYASSTPSSAYPSYSQSTYTPPSSVPGPSVPSVPSVPSYSDNSSSAPVSYTGSGSKTHTVASGENLYRISLKHGTTVAAIKSANGLTSDTIQAGQRLIIP